MGQARQTQQFAPSAKHAPQSSRDSQSPGASRKMARSPRLAHKAPVMQAIILARKY